MAQSFEVTREGLKLSYVRFLSDSAAGLILLLLLSVAYVLKKPMPIVGTDWLGVIPKDPSTELKVFLFIMAFILATPLGLMLNGISWFLLGGINIWLLKFWTWLPHRISLPVAATRRSYLAEETMRFFRLTPSDASRTVLPDGSNSDEQSGEGDGASPSATRTQNLYEMVNYYKALLSIYYPFYYDQLEAVRGLSLFSRNLSLLAMVAVPYCYLTLGETRSGNLAMGLFILLLLFNCLLEYYQCLKVLFMVYTLSSDLHSTGPFHEAIVTNLIERSAKLRSP